MHLYYLYRVEILYFTIFCLSYLLTISKSQVILHIQEFFMEFKCFDINLVGI